MFVVDRKRKVIYAFPRSREVKLDEIKEIDGDTIVVRKGSRSLILHKVGENALDEDIVLCKFFGADYGRG